MLLILQIPQLQNENDLSMSPMMDRAQKDNMRGRQEQDAGLKLKLEGKGLYKLSGSAKTEMREIDRGK